MLFKKTDIKSIKENPIELISDKWALLTAGTPDNYNTMTVSWGHIGEIWGAPSAIVYVRDSRNTFKYMEENDIYTLSFFDEKYKKALAFCGSHSGRDFDKAKETGLTPTEIDGTTSFEEARLVLVIKKKYAAMLDKNAFVSEQVYLDNYKNQSANNQAMHKQYIGEILAAYIK